MEKPRTKLINNTGFLDSGHYYKFKLQSTSLQIIGMLDVYMPEAGWTTKLKSEPVSLYDQNFSAQFARSINEIEKEFNLTLLK